MRVLRFLKSVVLAPEIYLAVLIGLVVLLEAGGEPKLENMELIRGGRTQFAGRVSEQMGKNEKFSVEFDLVSGEANTWELQIIPDDCAVSFFVNGGSFTPKDKRLCDWKGGFKIDASELPDRRAQTHFVVNMVNKGGLGGITVNVLSKSVASKVWLALRCLLLLALFLCLLHRMRMPVPLAAAILLAMALHFSYTLNTAFTERAHDVDSHIDYISYVVKNASLPAANECWECYQPPVYYAVSALVWRLGSWLGVQPERAVQWLSFLISFFVLALGVQALRSVLHGGSLFLASLLWLFWPVNTLASARIGNDILFYLGHVLCFFGALRYLARRDCKFLVLAAFGSWLAYWTKSTGFVTIAVFWLALALGYFPRSTLKPHLGEGVAVLLALLLLGSVALNVSGSSGLVGNSSGLAGSLKVEANAYNMLFFDFKDFLTTTAPSPWEDKGGRQFLLNYMAKTSLFGEFQLTNNGGLRTAATLLCFSFVALFAFALVGFWKKLQRRLLSKIDVFVLAQGLLFLAAMVYFRAKYPYACSSDFRYVVPALLSFVPFAGYGICRQELSREWHVLGALLAAVFIVSSVIVGLSYN